MKGEWRLHTRWRVLLLAVLLFAVLLARLCYPMAVERTRTEAARILAADLNELRLVETLGRAAAQRNWQEELAEAFLKAVFSRSA